MYRETSGEANLVASDPLEGFGLQPVIELYRSMETSESPRLVFSRVTLDVHLSSKRCAMSLDPHQSSIVEGAEISVKVADDPKTMDLLSLNFRTLKMREEKSLGEEYMEFDVQEQRIMHTEKKSLKNDKRRSRRKVTIDEDSSTNQSGQSLDTISLDELAWHDSAEDCWVAIYDYVYDCTEFVKSHPGGQDVLLEYAGRDATLAFIGSGHSSGARKMLEKYLIGELPVCERIFRTVGGVKIVQ